MSFFHLFARGAGAALLILAASCWPSLTRACACGCGVFDVGTSALLPDAARNSVFVQASYLAQDRNWAGSSSAPAADNGDKRIRSEFYDVGLRHMFNRDWGLMVELPYTQRYFASTDEDTGLARDSHHRSLGDVRIMGMYTGFSDDMSSGISFGVKLATGDWNTPGFDRDTAIGTGTTDLLLGGYHQWYFGRGGWGGFMQTQLDQPTATRAGYRPGSELDSALGAYPAGWTFANGMRLTPILQALLSWRAKDHGANADPANSGYQRLLFAPALELRVRRMRLSVDIERPVFQNVNGNQLVSHWQGKLTASMSF